MAFYPFFPLSGSGTSLYAGTTPAVPVAMAPVKWAFFNTDTQPLVGAYTYSNGASGVGATCTANANGTMSFFYEPGNTPAVGDRIVFVDPYLNGTGNPPYSTGIYTITSLGSASTPWVITRAPDQNTAATLIRYWTVQVLQGAIFGGGWCAVQSIIGVRDGGVFPPQVSLNDVVCALASQFTYASSPASTAVGKTSQAMGQQSSADGDNALSLGNTSQANGIQSGALGAGSFANGNFSTTLGNTSYANATGAVAAGPYTNAYAPGMVAIAGNQNNNPGDGQATSTIFGSTTADATPKLLSLAFGQAWIFEDWNGFGHTDWSKTLLVKAVIVARRTDVAGTDSVWTAQGVLRGDGISAYTWIGGVAPAAAVVAQDAAAAAWAVAVAVSNTAPGITVTVTGAAARTIQWCAEIQTVEVSNSTA